MSKVAIVTDSSPNIPEHLIKEYHIHVIPLNVIWGDESYYDGIEITNTEFYTRLETDKVMPSTSQPSVAAFEVLFRSLYQDGYEILGSFLSEELSGTISSATQAKKMLPEATIEIVNYYPTTEKSSKTKVGMEIPNGRISLLLPIALRFLNPS